jgi:predicted enzyme related to lactoylglutathione lyase
METAGPAAMIDTNSGAVIARHITALGHEPHNYSIFYVEVDDVKASLDRTEALGGKVLSLRSIYRLVPFPGSLIPKGTQSDCGSQRTE